MTRMGFPTAPRTHTAHAPAWKLDLQRAAHNACFGKLSSLSLCGLFGSAPADSPPPHLRFTRNCSDRCVFLSPGLRHAFVETLRIALWHFQGHGHFLSFQAEPSFFLQGFSRPVPAPAEILFASSSDEHLQGPRRGPERDLNGTGFLHNQETPFDIS